MTNFKAPLSPAIVESRSAHGKFAISSEQGLVLIGFYQRASDVAHAVEFLLDGNDRFAIRHLPRHDAAQWPLPFDDVIPLEVGKIDVEALEPGEFEQGARIGAGDIFITDGHRFLVGRPEDPRQGNVIDLDTKAISHINHGRGYIIRKWRLVAYREDGIEVLRVERT